jgi:hypothetical protein
MANNYTNFSLAFKLKGGTKARRWIEDLLTKASAAAGDDTEDKDILAVFKSWENYQSMGFEWDFESNNEMWINDGGGEGNVESVIEFLQAYLAKFDPKGKVGFEYANTCSSPRVGEFGGGAIVVKAKGPCKYVNTGEWLAKEMGK